MLFREIGTTLEMKRQTPAVTNPGFPRPNGNRQKIPFQVIGFCRRNLALKVARLRDPTFVNSFQPSLLLGTLPDTALIANRAADDHEVTAGRFDGLRGFDQHIELPADYAAIGIVRDRLGQLHQPSVTLDLHLFSDLITHEVRWRAGLRGVGERAKVLELLLFDEVEQLLELGVRLPGEADDERRAEHRVRHGVADVVAIDSRDLFTLGRFIRFSIEGDACWSGMST